MFMRHKGKPVPRNPHYDFASPEGLSAQLAALQGQDAFEQLAASFTAKRTATDGGQQQGPGTSHKTLCTTVHELSVKSMAIASLAAPIAARVHKARMSPIQL